MPNWENIDWSILQERLQEFAAVYGLNIIGALLILILGRIVIGIIRMAMRRVFARQKVEPTISSFIVNLTYFALMVFVVIAALSRLGMPTAQFVAVIGAAGLAIGLALQGSLSNFAAGFLIVLFRPFKVGDYVEMAGISGTVEEIEIFTTRVKSPDNKCIIIPNGQITADNIVNYTAKDTRRVDLVAGVSYSDDLDKVRSVLQDIAKQDPDVLEDPPPMIVVKEMADSSVNWHFRPWVKTDKYWDVFFRMNEAIKKRFDQEGISIPFPQRDVHLYEHKVEGEE
ncbi:MAG: mechanosensitive ion channel family protein [Candidatus Sumerlaeota bacterium]